MTEAIAAQGIKEEQDLSIFYEVSLILHLSDRRSSL